MRPDEAADLAARTLAVIPERQPWPSSTSAHHAADRERVASDLAGLRACYDLWGGPGWDDDADGFFARYADGLRRTAALYGVTP